MTTNSKRICLEKYGYQSKYFIEQSGRIYNAQMQDYIKIVNNHCYLTKSSGKQTTVYIKPLYRKVFNKEYCIDNIKNLSGEIWKEINGTAGRYFISNLGRVKSYCGYTAAILHYAITKKGYYTVMINRKNIKVHRLVATAFVANDQPTIKTIVHHINCDCQDNRAVNLIWLSENEHNKIHGLVPKEDI